MTEIPPSIRPCEVCGKPIEAVRLETVPSTRLCIEHCHKVSEFIYIRQERITRGKESSLKGTGVEITQKKMHNTAAVSRLREGHRSKKPG